MILELAYSLNIPSDSVSGASTSLSDRDSFDAATTINIACTSRWFNVQATIRLYTHVAITQPRALASLQRAISLRPQLGRLIKSLHVGAWDPLPESRHPLRARQAYVDDHGNQQPATTVLSHSLRSDSEAKLLPEGYTSASEWSFEHPDLDPRSMAISRAIVAAQQSLGIDLKNRNEWHYRYIPLLPLLRVQAALDLYLINMRNFESANHLDASSSSGANHDRKSPDYSPLIISNTATTSTSSRTDTPCTLTHRDLLRHLARPGAPTDRFDHPLLFARSGLDPTSSVYTRDSLDRWEPTDQFVRGPEDLADVFSSSGGLEHPLGNSRMSKEVLDPSLPSTATFGGLLALTRSLLAMTPRLENLSLTGFLERAVCGRRPIAAALKSLRCLSIGPPPETSQWYVPLRFEGLEEIQKLRVCGVMLRGDEVAQISGRYTELQSCLADQLPEEESKR